MTSITLAISSPTFLIVLLYPQWKCLKTLIRYFKHQSEKKLTKELEENEDVNLLEPFCEAVIQVSSIYFNSSFICSLVICFLVQKINSISETFGVGTLIAIPSSFPFNDGMISPIDFDAPVDVGTID